MATKKRRKSSGSATGSPARKKFGKKVYTKAACSRTKTDAKKKAASLRKSGKKARVVKTATGYCTYSAGSAKAAVGKRKRRTTRRKK